MISVPVAHVVERPLRDREVLGSKPGCAIRKALKMVPVATLLDAQHNKASTGFSSLTKKRIYFYSNNLNLLPPKPKLSFRHLKQSIQQFREKFVLALAEKAGNNAIVV